MSSMAAPRSAMGESVRIVLRDEDEENGDDSPSAKRPKLDRLPLTRWEIVASLSVFFIFSAGLFCVYLTMPAADFGKLKLPRSISDLRLLKYFPFPLSFLC